MQFFWFRLFPVALWACAASLIFFELRFFGQEPRSPRRRALRLAGCLLLGVLGAMIWFGQLPTSPITDPAAAWAMLRYWGLVFGLLLTLLSMALLDSIEGARALKAYLETVEHEEIDRVRQQLTKHGHSLDL
jgi:hypothetical protein